MIELCLLQNVVDPIYSTLAIRICLCQRDTDYKLIKVFIILLHLNSQFGFLFGVELISTSACCGVYYIFSFVNVVLVQIVWLEAES